MTDPSRVICIDLDGVLIRHYAEPFDPKAPLEPAMPGAAAFVRMLQDRGYTVVCLTARPACSHYAIDEHLRNHGILVSMVTNVKPPAAAYIDDRAVPFSGSWHQLMSSAAFRFLVPLETFLVPLETDAGQSPDGELPPSPDVGPASAGSSPTPLVHGRTNEAEGTSRPPSANAVPSASPSISRSQDPGVRSQEHGNGHRPLWWDEWGRDGLVVGARTPSSASPSAVAVVGGALAPTLPEPPPSPQHPLPTGRGSVYDHTTGHLPQWWYRADATPDETDLIAPPADAVAEPSPFATRHSPLASPEARRG